MPRRVFVDTGAWLALANASDSLHAVAVAAYPHILQTDTRLVTTNLVIGEAYNLIRRRLGHTPAMRFLQSLRVSPRLDKYYSTAEWEMAAEALLERYADQNFSFVDAVSFAMMHSEEIIEAFAFDKHFATAGFVLLPG